MMKPRFWTLVGMIAMAAIARLMPHPWNVSPVAAMALFGGAEFDNKIAAFGVPLLAMVTSDIILGFSSQTPLIYLCFALIVIIGFWIKKNLSVQRVVLGSVTSSVLFFAVTNFGTWASETMYPKTFQGLILCYGAGLPFFQNTLLGDLGYTAILFGTFYLASRAFPVLSDARAS